ncbi:N-(5-amino-5-carboxypentanoyl)-L-cysteinyl-D-valine synthase, partial [Actinobacteria bacterium OK074]
MSMTVETHPLTWGQQAMWFGQHLAGPSSVFHIARPFRVEGDLDTAALRLALARVTADNAALRTTFRETAAGPVAVVHPRLEFAFHEESPAGGTGSDDPAARDAWLREQVRAPFDLENGPLVRLALRRDAAGQVGVLAAHHLVADLWTLGLFLRELRTAYEAVLDGGTSPVSASRLDTKALTFAEHARQDRARWTDGTDALDHFRRAGLRDLPPLDLGVSRAEPAAPTGPGGLTGFELPPPVLRGLREQSRALGTSLFSTLMTGYASALQRWSGAEELTLGYLSSGRVAPYTALTTFGYFVNTVPLPVRIDPGEPFAEQARRLHADVREAQEYQSYPFPLLVEELNPNRGSARVPFVQAMFSLQKSPGRDRRAISAFALGHADAAFALGDAAFVPLPLVPVDVQHELSLLVAEDDGALHGVLEYDAGVFDEATVAGFAAALGELYAGVARDPGRRVGTLPLAPAPAWEEPRPAHGDPSWSGGVHREILARLARRPDRVVVRSGTEQPLTGGELLDRINAVASALRAAGVGVESHVGLHLRRGPDLVVGMLGVLAAGGCYVPLDPAQPAARLASVAQQADFAAVLDDSGTAPDWLPAGITVVGPTPKAAPDETGTAQVAWDQAAYAVFTSGSTGAPKGVVVPHGALSNLLDSMIREPGLAAHDRLVAVTTATFDIAVFELLGTLAAGAQLIVADEEQSRDPAALAQLLDSVSATVLQATPATWQLLLETGWRPPHPFRALVGGEALPTDLAAALRDRCTEVWNCYGPTETTVWSAILPVVWGPVRIGGPVTATDLMVVDDAFAPVPPGIPGELLIGGDGLARG